ncbi:MULTISPECIES: PadR family transcriptional regulator [Thermococcus]|uniref:Transcriptional regulator, padR-like family n=2 Tax=Thermococcus sibiricus TaxID=172049 RepID=C6A530_THESM|nr:MULTISPECIES: PadR family transcriptional regulator [Thermococcus]KUK28479.1 MAG: Transcriptional regulator, padR-like family [Thermococcus sp. 40_45]HII67250.1 PadR family transcriptional regulator [Thermococcaceae archaeon]ACS90725.1 Transcriptional regulator, padR-like family [Thermococcus sibiricus MM 739]KUK17519.1 MAG: Transcriptional regulator, padR-like family [Thermococcus sibiricus]MBC7094258.1 PadR family transcriptional regulator [Thermococcus sp.]
MMRRIILGFMGLHILHHASKEAITGTFMMKELENHGYKVSPGTIYPLLQNMEKLGLLKSTWKIKDGRRIRTYQITQEGIKVLEESKKKVKELCMEILGDTK